MDYPCHKQPERHRSPKPTAECCIPRPPPYGSRRKIFIHQSPSRQAGWKRGDARVSSHHQQLQPYIPSGRRCPREGRGSQHQHRHRSPAQQRRIQDRKFHGEANRHAGPLHAWHKLQRYPRISPARASFTAAPAWGISLGGRKVGSGQSATFRRRKRPGPLLGTEAVRRWSAPMGETVTPSVVH